MRRPSFPTLPARAPVGPVEAFVLVIALAGAAVWLVFDMNEPALAGGHYLLSAAAIAVFFYFVEAHAVHVHFRSESHSISLNEIGLVAGLLFLAPSELILAQLVGGGAALLLRRRQRRIKVLFNLATFLLSTSATVAIFRQTLGDADAFGPVAWVAALVATCCGSLIGIVLVSAVIFLAEREWSAAALVRTGAISLSATAATASFAFASILLVRDETWALVLLAAPALALAFMFRSFMVQTRNHQHLTFLYESMAATQGAPDFGLAVTQLMTALRDLVRAEYAEIILFLSDDETGMRSASGRGTDVLLQPVTLSPVERHTVARVTADGGAMLVARGQDAGVVSAFMRSRGIQDALFATFVDDERVFGLMVAGARAGDVATFTRDELSLAKTFAGHAAVLLENGRLEKTLADVTELQGKLKHLAYHDPLTGLPNRASFLECVEAALARRAGVPPAVLFLDIDDFKTINDTHGHGVGDELLVAFADRLRTTTEGDDLTAARLGGDEFAVLVHEARGDAAQLTAEQVRAALAAPIAVGTRVFPVAPSIGIAVGAPEISSDELMRNADVAMYAAKQGGKGSYAVFEPSMYERIRDRHDLAHDLRRALDADEITALYQPIVRLADGEITAVEALVRWEHPERGLLLPEEFLSVAEDTGLIGRIDEVVMSKACAAVAGWRSHYPAYRDLRLNVNVSPDELASDAVVSRIQHVLERNALDMSMLTVEITETAAMDDAVQAVTRAHRLAGLGVELAIDDFGTGHSSLARLGQFPLQTLKIARPFVDRLDDPEGKASFVAAILEIAKAVGAAAVAEGVETEAQANLLRKLGCELAQGFLFARPLREPELAELLAARTRLPYAA